MQSICPMNDSQAAPRWTPLWVVVISAMTPLSAWLLHTVSAESVPWYLGIMAWLILTPDRRPRWMHANRQIQMAATSREIQNPSTATATPPATIEPIKPESNLANEPGPGKTKKTRAKARKPKAVTLAEMKSLTSGADRAVVWSQVGPGKFVRQAGEEDSADSEFNNSTSGDSTDPAEPVMISPTIGRNDTVIEMETEESYDD